MAKLRLIACLALLALVVAVDFTSRVMSILSDGLLVAAIVFIALPVFKKQ